MAAAIFGTCIYGGGTMRGYLAFTKKEFIECIRSYKFMILIIVFLAFGFMNPIFAKYMPELLKSMMPDGMSMKLPEPTVLDSWAQFFKNVNQMGLIIFLLSFSSIISTEFQKGTLINMVTKGLSRKKIILSKTTFLVCIWTICYIGCALVTLGYGLIFWTTWQLPHLLLSLTCVWLFGIMMCILMLFGSIITGSSAGGLLLSGGIYIGFMLLDMLPDIKTYNPVRLISDNMALLQETLSPDQVYPAIGICLVICIITYIGAVIVFNRKQL